MAGAGLGARGLGTWLGCLEGGPARGMPAIGEGLEGREGVALDGRGVRALAGWPWGGGGVVGITLLCGMEHDVP